MKKRLIYMSLWLILIVLVLCLAVGPFLKNRINKVLRDLDGAQIEHNEDDLELSLISRSVCFHDARIALNIGDSTRNELDLRANAIGLSGISIFKLLWDKQIQVNELKLDEPRITYRMTADTINKHQETKGSNDLSIGIGMLQLRNGEATYSDERDGSNMRVQVERFDVQVKGFEMVAQDWSLEDLTLNFNNVELITADSTHQITLAKLQQDGKELRLDQLQVSPTSDKQQLARQFKFRKSMNDISVASIVFEEPLITDLLHERPLLLNSVAVDDLDATFYIDKGIPIDPARYMALPQEQLRELAHTLSIDSILLNDANMRYEEFEPKNNKVGFVHFDEMNATITNITNDSARIARNEVMAMNVTTLFQGVGEMKAEFKFNLLDADCKYHYHSTLGPMQVDEVNTILIPVANLFVKTGVSHGIELSINANKFASLGKLNFDYEDLKVMRLGDELKETNGIVSSMINIFLINTNNTRSKGKFKEGEVNSKRDPIRPITNQLWKAAQSGLMTTILPGILQTEEVEE